MLTLDWENGEDHSDWSDALGFSWEGYKNKTALDGFETVLGDKWNCQVCYYYKDCSSGGPDISGQLCELFILSDKTRKIISHIMRESDDLGIDTHPRHLLGSLIFVQDDWDFIPQENPKNKKII